MHFFKNIVFLLLGFTVAQQAAAAVVDIGKVKYSLSNVTGEATAIGVATNLSDWDGLEIPDFVTYKGIDYPVTSIADKAFLNKNTFEGSLIIGNNVKTIGSSAFNGCSGFSEELKIGESVQYIRDYAFARCSGFTGSLVIGDNVETIGAEAFLACSGFTDSLKLGNNLQVIDRRAFYWCSGFTGSLVIGDNVKSIGLAAFYSCSGFSGSLVIGNNVESIGYEAFAYCHGFTGSLIIGENVQEIGHSAFYRCSGFTGSLTIGDNVQLIDGLAFYCCSGLSGTLYLGKSIRTITSAAFSGIDNFSEIIIPAADQVLSTNSCEDVFSAKVIDDAILRVPKSLVEDYRTSDTWGVFTNISAIEDIEPLPAEGIELQPLTFYVGESVRMGATVLPEDATAQEISWSSDAPSVAAVDADGKVWFNSAGEATVSAECQGFSKSMTFRVEAVEAQELNVFPAEAAGTIGNSFYLLALHNPDNTTDKSVIWESSNPEIAEVDSDGRVELKSEGQAEITATSGNHSATSVITVGTSTQLVELAGNGVAIRVTDGGIDILNAPVMARVIVSTTDGRVVTAMYAETPELHIPLIQGIYIVKVGDTTTAKILI